MRKILYPLGLLILLVQVGARRVWEDWQEPWTQGFLVGATCAALFVLLLDRLIPIP